MKARLIKKGEQRPTRMPPAQKPTTKPSRRSGPAVDPREAFAALFVKPTGGTK